jgi:oligoribonuclease
MQAKIIPTKLLWVDLEMTGLDANKDVILEIAAEITDFSFVTLDSFEARITHSSDVVLERMRANSWWQHYPENRDDFIRQLPKGKRSSVVEKEFAAFIEKNFGSEPAVLAGNSIHSDRAFIATKWPLVDVRLHYRMLDVSSFKLLMQGKYGVFYEKKEVHRAFDDIQASIAELQHYITWWQKEEK